MAMQRGSTPLNVITLPFDASEAKEIWVTYAQDGIELFTKYLKDITVNGSKLEVILSQQDTLLFHITFPEDETPVEIQAAVGFSATDIRKSEIIHTNVGRVLKDGVMNV